MTSTGAPSRAPGLRFLLDSAERAAWAEWLPLGCFHGVTTNPVLLKAADVPCTVAAITDLVRRAIDLGAGEVHAQTWGRARDAYLEHGRAWAAIDPKVVVKVPTTVEGAAAAAKLRDEGVRLTMTAVYTVAQALIASALGAEYAAPYLGRMNDAGHDGFGEIAAMAEIARAGLFHAHSRGLLAAHGRHRPPRRRGVGYVHVQSETGRRVLLGQGRGCGRRGVRGGGRATLSDAEASALRGATGRAGRVGTRARRGLGRAPSAGQRSGSRFDRGPGVAVLEPLRAKIAQGGTETSCVDVAGGRGADRRVRHLSARSLRRGP